MQKVNFGSKGKVIQGTLILPQTVRHKNPGVILIHGFSSSEKNYIPLGERLAEIGIITLTINLRGHAVSNTEGNSFKVHDGFLDGLQAYDYLVKNESIDDERIGMCGASFGGGISAYVSNKRKVKSLVLRAPATYTDSMMGLTLTQLMQIEKDKFNNMSDITNTPAIRSLVNFTGDILIIESEKDSIIPAKMINAFLNAPVHPKRKELIEIKGATHDLSQDSWREEFRSATVNWFKQTLF